MTHALKIRAVGSSLGVIIPKELLNTLNIKEGDNLYLTEGADGFRVSVQDPDFDKFLEAAKDIHQRYRNAFRELSK